MENWVIVKSKSGFCIEGFPVGEILVRDGNYRDVIKERRINDAVVEKYNPTEK